MYNLKSFYSLSFTFDLWRSPEVNKFIAIRKPVYDFLFYFYRQHISISYCFRDIWFQTFQGLTLTYDQWREPKVKNIFIAIQNLLYDFLF